MPSAHRCFLKARSNQIRDEIRFWFDGNDVRATYGNQYSILNFDNSRYGLLLNHHHPEGYSMTKSFTEFNSNPELAVKKLDRNQIIERLRLVDKPTSLEGTYSFEADSSLQTYVSRRLMMTEGTGQHKLEKGKLGEEVSTAVLTIAGWEEFQNHPKNKRSENGASRLDLPDSLILHKDSRIIYFFEFKWARNPEIEMKNACLQVKKYAQNWDKHIDGLSSTYAFAACLNWYPLRSKGTLRVKRVALKKPGFREELEEQE